MKCPICNIPLRYVKLTGCWHCRDCSVIFKKHSWLGVECCFIAYGWFLRFNYDEPSNKVYNIRTTHMWCCDAPNEEKERQAISDLFGINTYSFESFSQKLQMFLNFQ